MRQSLSIQADMRRRAAKVLRAIDIFWTHRRTPVNSDSNINLLRDQMLKAIRRMKVLTYMRTRKDVWALAREVQYWAQMNPEAAATARAGMFEDVSKALRWASNFAEKEDRDV